MNYFQNSVSFQVKNHDEYFNFSTKPTVGFCSSYVETFSTEQLSSMYAVYLFFFPEAFNFVIFLSASQVEKRVAEPMTYY